MGYKDMACPPATFSRAIILSDILVVLRIFAAFVLAGIALGVALLLHRSGHTFETICPSQPDPRCSGRTHPAWADPAAVVVAVVGIGAAVALLVSASRKAVL
jgi:hypothetical protein